MKFPLICGGSGLGEERRDLRFARALWRAAGQGGFPDDETSLPKRALRSMALPLACAEAANEYAGHMVLPVSALAGRGLERWESALGLTNTSGLGQEARQARAGDALAPAAGARPTDVAYEVSRAAGVTANVRVNRIAALDAGGYDRRLVAVIFVELPFDPVPADHAALLRVAQLAAPAEVTVGVSRAIGAGFRCDDPYSLMDRDALSL